MYGLESFGSGVWCAKQVQSDILHFVYCRVSVISFHFLVSVTCPGSGSVLTTWNGTLSDGPGKYTNNENCFWIVAPRGATSIALEFLNFELEGFSPCCEGDWVKIFECQDVNCSSTSRKLLMTLSGLLASIPPTITTETSVMAVEFSSDYQQVYSGFDAVFWVPCPAGTYGPRMPFCNPCSKQCPPGKVLFDSICGNVGATKDNICRCPGGQFSHDDSPFSPCQSCQKQCPEGVYVHT